MHFDRHEIQGTYIRLYTGEGYIEMPASNIAGFEVDPDAPVAPSTAPTAASVPAEIIRTGPLTPLELADAAADKYGLERALVRIVMSTESSFQKKARSSKGAIGLMQLMPATARELGVDPHDAAQNVDAGVRYLADLLKKYNGGLWRALAAYNAGPGAVDKYLSSRYGPRERLTDWVPPYRETIDYVNRIDRAYQKALRLEAAASKQ